MLKLQILLHDFLDQVLLLRFCHIEARPTHLTYHSFSGGWLHFPSVPEMAISRELIDYEIVQGFCLLISGQCFPVGRDFLKMLLLAAVELIRILGGLDALTHSFFKPPCELNLSQQSIKERSQHIVIDCTMRLTSVPVYL